MRPGFNTRRGSNPSFTRAEPTIEVAFDPRYAAGNDPRLERAV
jgi:hypothetical protein